MSDEIYEPAHFLNVDLVIESTAPLQELVEALREDAMAQFHGELDGSWRAVLGGRIDFPSSPEEVIQALLRAIARLPENARRLWDQASRRTFDIGFQSGHDRTPLEEQIGAETLSAVATLGAGIQVTVYAPERSEDRARALNVK